MNIKRSLNFLVGLTLGNSNTDRVGLSFEKRDLSGELPTKKLEKLFNAKKV